MADNIIISPEIITEIIDYADEHANDRPDRLLLSIAKDPRREILTFAIDQIIARRKFAHKLPSFIAKREFLFPTLLAGEQASNETVARYHASLFGSGNIILDMTAGLGIDSLTAASADNDVTACELDTMKAKILTYNSKIFATLRVINIDSLKHLHETDIHYDIIFADPARRGNSNQRIYNPADCLPDVVTSNEYLLSRTDRLIVKHSPMLDITMARKLFLHLAAIHLVCYKGELKEVLTEQHADYDGIPEIICVDICDVGETIVFSYTTDSEPSDVIYAAPSDVQVGKYISIPNSALMKAGAWAELSTQFPGLKKLDKNTHIFISDQHPDSLSADKNAKFPGRIMKISSIPDKHELKTLKGEHYNVVSRNYVMDAPALEKKLKVKPGGDHYIIGLRCATRPLLLLCQSTI